MEKREMLILLGISLLVISTKFNILNTAHYWDAVGIDIPASLWIKENLSLWPGQVSNGHPPFTYILIAIFYSLFGISPFVARLPILISIILGLFYTYKIGKLVYSEIIGILSVGILFTMPIYFSQAGIVMSTTLAAGLTPILLYYTLRKNIVLFSTIGVILLLVRETTLFMVIICSIYLFLKLKSRGIKELFLLSLPIFVFLVWITGNKIIYGWFLFPQSAGFFNINAIFSSIIPRMYTLFFEQYRVLLLLPIIIAFYLGKKANNFEKISAAIVFSYLAFYSFLSKGFLPRYFLFLFFFLTVVGVGSLHKIWKDKIFFYAAYSVIIVVLFVSIWHGNRTIPAGWQLETNMEYLDVIYTHQKAANYLDENFPDETILTCWPLTKQLSNPALGYVNHAFNTIAEGNAYVMVVSVQSNCYNMDVSQFDFLKEFRKNGKVTRIYINPSFQRA